MSLRSGRSTSVQHAPLLDPPQDARRPRAPGSGHRAGLDGHEVTGRVVALEHPDRRGVRTPDRADHELLASVGLQELVDLARHKPPYRTTQGPGSSGCSSEGTLSAMTPLACTASPTSSVRRSARALVTAGSEITSSKTAVKRSVSNTVRVAHTATTRHEHHEAREDDQHDGRDSADSHRAVSLDASLGVSLRAASLSQQRTLRR